MTSIKLVMELSGLKCCRNIRTCWPAWPNLSDNDCCSLKRYIIPDEELQRAWLARGASTLSQQEPMPNALCLPVGYAAQSSVREVAASRRRQQTTEHQPQSTDF